MTTTYMNRNPNDTLAEFFKRKGDEPLSEIEVEGVMSLINKTQQLSQQQIFPNRTMTARPEPTSNNNSTLIHGYTTIGGNSTILRPSNLKTPVKIHTPSYKPKTRIIRRPHRQSRIVQYGNQRPSKAKMMSPLDAFREEKRKKGEVKRRKGYTGGIIDLSHLGDSDGEDGKEEEEEKNLKHKPVTLEIEIEDRSKVKLEKPISKTASRVLSILRGEKVEKVEKGVEKGVEKAVSGRVRKKEVPIMNGNGGSSSGHPTFHFSTSFSKEAISKKTEGAVKVPGATKAAIITKSDGSKVAPGANKGAIITSDSKVTPVVAAHPLPSVFPVRPKFVPPSLSTVEQIDRFTFPDVAETNQQLLKEVPSVSLSQAIPTSVPASLSTPPPPAPLPASIPTFSFPSVPEASPSVLATIDDKSVHLYDDVFNFDN
ncbi:DEKNAAC104308 [Brettanomyces naardenensis]|uniref:DEKNAAC104308 n=1 Tax=Brettanomyces naardenensis TaxID=13370 RepID=A0A448YQI1_BRENA|nr:DEKNAAC104308 [Brettanomyces naardenensis]